MEAAVNIGMRFLLVVSGLYGRGEAAEKLRGKAKQHGFPIVGPEELLDIGKIAQSRL